MPIPPSQWRAQILSEITRLVSEGWSGSRIARELDVSETALYAHFKRCGIPSSRTPAEIKERNRLIVEAYRSGEKVLDIAARMGISAPSVSAIARKAGAEPRGGLKYGAHEDEIVRRYKAGDSMHKLAIAYEIDVKTVSRILQRHGIHKRSMVESVLIAKGASVQEARESVETEIAERARRIHAEIERPAQASQSVAEIRRLRDKGLGTTQIAALLRCRYAEVTAALEAR